MVPATIPDRLLNLGMTRARDWAAKVDRAATDPEHIERRKAIAPALIVPRFREPTVAYLPAAVLDAMEASETKVPESHAIKARELRAKFLVTTSLKEAATEFGVDLEALRSED